MSLKRQTLWSFLPLATLTVLNLVSVPLFYRYLGPEMYALWFYVQTLGSSFGFIDFGMGVAVGRYLGVALGRGDRAAAKEYWATGNATAIPFILCMAAVFSAVGAIFGPRWFNVAAANIPLLRWSFIAGGASLFLSYYLVFWNVLSQAHLDFKFISLVRVSATILQIIPAIILARLTSNPLVLILWTLFIAICELVVFILHARSNYAIGLNFGEASLARLKEMASYTGKSFATILVNSIFGSIDRLLAGRLALPVDFASYTIASNLGSRLSAFSYAAAAPVFNNTSRSTGDPAAMRPARIYDETFGFLIGWYALAIVGAAVWSLPAAEIWLGPVAGARVAPFLPPLVLAYSLTAISILSSTQLGALNRVGTQALFGLLSGVLTIPCVYAGWKIAGIPGLAWGFLASRTTLIAQDIFLIHFVGARGWFSVHTWTQIFAQAAVGSLFLPLRNSAHASVPLTIFLMLLHATLASCWIMRRSFLRVTRDCAARFRRALSS